MADSVALWCTIQSWVVVVPQNPGCMLAGLGNLCVRVEHWAAAGQEAA